MYIQVTEYIYKTQVLWTMSFFLGSRGFIKTKVGMCVPLMLRLISLLTFQPLVYGAKVFLCLFYVNVSKLDFFQCLT